jgi:hypothetical protein
MEKKREREMGTKRSVSWPSHYPQDLLFVLVTRLSKGILAKEESMP